MVEVFKTNVDDPAMAEELLSLIHGSFTDYHANFDLEDCDRILRVKSMNGLVHSPLLISLLGEKGFMAVAL